MLGDIVICDHNDIVLRLNVTVFDAKPTHRNQKEVEQHFRSFFLIILH